MISRLVGGTAVGLYAAAALIAQTLDLVAASILTVFLPRFSNHTETAPLRRQVAASLRCSLLVVLPLMPCYFFIQPLMTLLFGDAYAGAIPFVRIMYFAVLFTMITHPLHVLFYARGRPQILTALDTLLLVFSIVAHYFAITRFGAIGAAWVVFALRILAGTLLSLAVTFELSAGRRPPGE
jgi:O-antigen/teichoic acid export membrane protein